MVRIGRNDPCSCGSGKKYKKCCLQRDAALAPTNILDMAYESYLKIRQSADESLFKAFSLSLDIGLASKVVRKVEDNPFLEDEEIEKLFEQKEFEDRIAWVQQQAVLTLYSGNRGESALDIVLRKFASRFTEAEVRFLRERESAPFSCYQFCEFFPQQGYVKVRDVFDGAVYKLYDKTLSKQNLLHTIITGKILPFPERAGYVMESPMPSVMVPGNKEEILKMLAFAVNVKAGGKAAKQKIKQRLAENPIGVFWLELFNCYHECFPTLPTLVNRDGHDLVDVKAEYSFTNAEEVISDLLSLTGFEMDDETGPVLVWLNKENTLLARINFNRSAGIAVAELNSLERFQRFKKLLKPFSSLKYLSMTKNPLDEREIRRRMNQAEGPGLRNAGSKFSREEIRDISGEVYRRWEKDWLRQKIPALDGKTPIQASRSMSGREKLCNLLDDFEYKNSHVGPDSPMHYFNFDDLRQKLGLVTESD